MSRWTRTIPPRKLRRIRDIHLAGSEVAHVIHRHGLDDRTAFEVEAALMDAYPGLTNLASGLGNAEFGAMRAIEIVRRYAAEPAQFQNRALLISVNRSAADASLYEATRFLWKISPAKARPAAIILATLQGMIVGAFIADQWLEATTENFPGRDTVPVRMRFDGAEASDPLKRIYVGKRVPDEYRRAGAPNPVKYTWR